ncbi:MAG: hypothetical protein LJE64_12440 [Desulfofustis sp.]|jgi:hypothetical protein|nr:hypothetical protein [Desulfofustis sp.]
MNWKLKALMIWILSVPAFSGFPLEIIPGSLPLGIECGWILYGAVVFLTIALLLGRKMLKVSLFIAGAVMIPLVVLGGVISSVGLFISGWRSAGFVDILRHYAGLAATMTVVIPLALAMVTVLPFYRLESSILKSGRGVAVNRKIALMFLRVFSHIFYFVIPNILEVVREEGVLPARRRPADRERFTNPAQPWRIRTMARTIINIGVEAICSAIRFVPLWAEEISMLPDGKKSAKTDGKRTSDNDR